jgi:uncharacterized protein YggT (Ycf19 family)
LIALAATAIGLGAVCDLNAWLFGWLIEWRQKKKTTNRRHTAMLFCVPFAVEAVKFFVIISKHNLCDQLVAFIRRIGLHVVFFDVSFDVSFVFLQDTERFIKDLVPPVLKCFLDQDHRVRYYACESLYNISKVARGHILIYFNEIFDALCKVISAHE